MERIKTAEIDMATYLVMKGYDYKVVKENGTVFFIFEGENLQQAVREFPSSDVNKILSVYYGLQKLVRTTLHTGG